MVTHLVEDGLERADRALLLDRDHQVALAATAPATARGARVRSASTAGSSAAARARHERRRPVLAGALGQPRRSSRTRSRRAALAGALLGFIGVHVVLRRMVFASSAIAQAAALGVALSFWVPALVDPVRHAAGHAASPAAHLAPSLLFEPVLWAIAASLLATLVFIANPVHLHLTRESLLGLVFLASGAGAVIIGDRASTRRRTTWRRSCSAARSSCSRWISMLVALAHGGAAGRPPAVLARAAVRRLRPDGGARAGDAGARPQRASCSCPSGWRSRCARARWARCRCSRSACCPRWRRWRSRRASGWCSCSPRSGRDVGRRRLRDLVPRRAARRRHPDRDRGGAAGRRAGLARFAPRRRYERARQDHARRRGPTRRRSGRAARAPRPRRDRRGGRARGGEAGRRARRSARRRPTG